MRSVLGVLGVFSLCSAEILLHDDFSSCVTQPAADAWHLVTRVWGGADINGGVVPDQVSCTYDADLGKQVLTLTAHGDLFNGTGPIGNVRSGSSVRPRGASEPFKGWAWGAYEPVGRGCAPYCNVRRVGGAVSSLAAFDSPVHVEARVLPCPDDGGLTALWLYNYTEVYCDVASGDTCTPAYQDWCCGGEPCTLGNDRCEGEWISNQEIDIELPTAPSSVKADTANPFFINFNNIRFSTYTALAPDDAHDCSSTPPCEAHKYATVPGPLNDGEWHTLAIDFIPGTKAAFSIDGNVLATISNPPSGARVVPDLGHLWLGTWFPNAWAGSPNFDVCHLKVDYVTVSTL